MNTSKIIKGAVSNGRYTVTAPIVKEDYGLYLKIEGVELPETYQVDFSNNENSGTSVTMIGNADGVRIPAQFIKSGKDVFAFLYHVGADFGRTVYKFRIPNKVRPDRTNEEPTPEEQSTIDQAINALNEAVEQTSQDKADADASAQSAKEDADRAEQAKDDAVTFAQRSANSAQASADYSASAQTSATASANSASASAQSAQSAEQSAQTAQDALEEFTTPTASATTLPEGSNATATYADGHFSFGIPRGDKGERGEQGIQGERGLQGERGEKGEQGDDYVLTEQDKQDIADIAEADLTPTILNAFPTDTASGAIASFPDGADGLPLKSLVVNIDPVQDLSNGDPSPENICPISGWTGMQLRRDGKNLFPHESVTTYTWGFSQNYDLASAKNPVFIKANTEYTLTLGGGIKIYRMRFWDIDGNVINPRGIVTMTSGTSTGLVYYESYKFAGYSNANASTSVSTFSSTQDVWFDFVTGNTVSTNNQLEVGNSATSYVPYQGTTIPISWQTEAGTVYGGKLDVLTGILTVYPEYDSYNGETLTGRWISDRDVYAVGTTPTIGAQVVNIGAEGTEIQLEPHEIASLLGANNIFADTGDSEVEYRADTKLYIEKLTQPEEDDMIADSAITSGQFFMIGNTLYRALASIASGATITVGTNAQRVSLSDALNLVNA